MQCLGIYVASGKANQTTFTLNATPTAIDNYTPANKKLLQYPYVYVGFNPRQGTQKIYRYEDFSSTPSFKLISEVNPNPSVYIVPQNYRGKSNNINDAGCLNGYPQIASKVDVYNSWLAENSGIINVQAKQTETNYNLDTIGASIPLFTGILGISGANSTKGDNESIVRSQVESFGQVVNSALNITKLTANYGYYIKMLNAQKEKQAMLPDNVTMGGSNATLLGYEMMDDSVFTQYNIRRQFAKRIDDFFSAYGYETDEFKIPNLWNRKYWNYVKTQGANITGDMPQEAVQTLKIIFDNGITLWHDVNHFLDYSQNNRE